jgi:hypothetical protein
MAQIVEPFDQRQLAFAELPLRETYRDLSNHGAGAFHDQLQRNLVAYRAEWSGPLVNCSSNREKARHSVLNRGQRPGKRGRYFTIDPAQ